MKKYFLIPMLGLILVCCTKEREVNNGDVGGDPNVSAVTNYLTISIVAAGNAGSRADNNGSIADDDTYKDGDGYENNVKMIRFYFFDDAGDAAPAWKLNGSKAYESYVDWYLSAGNIGAGDKNETVEKIVEDITLGINTVEGKRPTQILAVVNPSVSLLNLRETYTFTDSNDEKNNLTIYGLSLKDIIGNLAKTDDNYLTSLKHAHSGNSQDSTEGNFVMSNSVYLETDGSLVNTVKLTEENFRDTTTAADGKETHVVIYVERVVARLDLENKLSNDTENITITVDGENGEKTTITKTIYKVASYPVEGETDPDPATGDKDIYILIDGWNVTTTPIKSRLVKEIDKTWPDELFGNIMRWNVSAFHRSFWAINPFTLGDNDYQYGMFDKDAKDKDGKLNSESHPNPANCYAFPAKGAPTTVYMQENAGKSITDPSTFNPTKVIIAAQLVDKTGKPYPMAEWAYKKYTLDNLKYLFANSILGLYSKTTDNGVQKYTKITPGDLTFKTRSSFADEDKDYYVYATLTEDAAKLTWYTKTNLADEDNTSDASFKAVENVDQYIYDRINHVKVWNNGLTYYYFDIKHLAEEGNPGDLGVVRNHIYKADVTKILGLGTPVYDPDNEVIKPEMPEDDESIITTDVKILQWRIVNAQYDIQWPN